MNISFQQPKLYSVFLAVMFLAAPMVAASQNPTTLSPQPEGASRQLIHEAAQAVDEAWEEFHRAAIGGTLASPSIQTKIEGQLHEARGLLMEARKAERKGDHRSVKKMTEKLLDLSHDIVMASREKKR